MQDYDNVPVVSIPSEGPNQLNQFLPALAIVQMVVCAGIAVWDYIHTGDLGRFILFLALGQMNLPQLMRLLSKITSRSGPP